MMSFCVSNRSRSDVVTVTPWLAPVVWEGTFDPHLLDSIYKLRNITVTATVFAVGKYEVTLWRHKVKGQSGPLTCDLEVTPLTIWTGTSCS